MSKGSGRPALCSTCWEALGQVSSAGAASLRRHSAAPGDVRGCRDSVGA